ncbi:hypothetical protein BGZ82_011645 [Podila clonocystis]|nr:hypothetical protein BGZ82_011645 [Podila clonocystis]
MTIQRSNRPRSHVQQTSNYTSPPLPPFPQTPLPPESSSLDSDIDDSTSVLEEQLGYTDETTATFVETDETDSFQFSSENQKIYDEASEWFENRIQRKIEDTIKGLCDHRFDIPWVHDLLYDCSLKLLKCGLDSTTDENTYTSCWIAPDFTALRTGIDGLISKGFINETTSGHLRCGGADGQKWFR